MGGKTQLHFPPELLEQIFKYLERPFELTDPSRERRRKLFPLLFVCKEWHAVALPVLYSSVPIDITDRWVREECEGICDTFRRNPSIASYVRGLGIISSSSTLEDSLQHIDILRLCTNVKCVELQRISAILGELGSALAQMDLEEFSVFEYGLQQEQPGSRHSLKSSSTYGIIHYLHHWPRLRRLVAQAYKANALSSSVALRDLPAPTGYCPKLREVVLTGCRFSADFLLVLSKLAPNVESAEISLEKFGSMETLKECFRRWSTTLVRLSVESKDKDSLSPACVSLQGTLRSLHVWSQNMPPDSLHGFANLETLEYTCTSFEIEHISINLENDAFLPSMKILNLRRTEEYLDWFHEEVEDVRRSKESIQTVCQNRNILLSNSIRNVRRQVL